VQICYMSKPVSDQFAPLESCEHGSTLVCKECYVGHLKYEIDNGKVQDGVACCVDGCSTKLSEDQLRPLVPAATLAKYGRFRANAEDATLRECFNCNTMQSGDPDNPIMRCVKCGSQFCYYHATRHEPTDEACRKYHVEQRSVDAQNLKLLSKTAAACPRCKAVTTKSEGCNHMTCRCKAEWCWLCGMDITGNHQWHYTPGNPIGCPSLMMSSGEPNSRRDAVLAAIAEQNTGVGRAKNFFRGLLALVRLPFELAVIVVAAVIVFSVCIIIMPCMCCACFMVKSMQEAQPLAIYVGLLVASSCLLPLVILRLVFLRLYVAGFLIFCCRTPPNQCGARPDGLGPIGGAPQFGEVGEARLQRDEEHFAKAGAAAPREGHGAAAAAASSSAGKSAADERSYGATAADNV